MKPNARLALWLCLFASFVGIPTPKAQAFELFGTMNFSKSSQSPAGYNTIAGGSGIGYHFAGRMGVPFVPFLYAESGFSFFPVGLSILSTIGNAKAEGSYWSIPLMFRMMPISYIGLGLGLDYSVVGSSKITVQGTTLTNTSLSTGYKGHFGGSASLLLQYPLVESLSVILDTRYRIGLDTALIFENQNRRLNVFSIGLGISKQLF